MKQISEWQKIPAEGINENIFRLIGTEWMLITSGNVSDFNTMTASWGMLGVLWNKTVSAIFIRPHRHTFQYTNKYPYYTLSFFEDTYKDILNYCGSHSGKNVNKIENTGLIPIQTELGNIYFEQARMVLECKKIYTDDLADVSFLDKNIISTNYPKNDFHRFYIGEIVTVLEKKTP